MKLPVRAWASAAVAVVLVAGGATALASDGGSPPVSLLQVTTAPVHAQPGGAAALPIPLAGPLDDNMTEPECQAHVSATSPRYGKTRFVACVASGFVFTSLLCQQNFTNCRPIGGGTFNVTSITKTQNGGRSVHVTQTVDAWTRWGDIVGLDLSDQVRCQPSNPGSGPCFGFGGPIVQSVVSWIVVGRTTRTFDFTQPALFSGDPDLISYAFNQATFTLTSIGAPTVASSTQALGFRCDSAPYVVGTYAGEGCVFDWVTETLHYSLSNPSQREAASHIQTAQTNPGSTIPPVPGKFIPGAPGSQPLHRITEIDWVNKNTAIAVAACNRYFPGYARRGLQCDEYPFKSTLEGAASQTNGYSVLPIRASDNMSAGASLGNFYTARRVLGLSDHHDPFFVQIDP